MTHCVNIKHKDFQRLMEETGLDSLALSTKMGVWMKNNNTDEWPSLKELGLQSISGTFNENSTTSPESIESGTESLKTYSEWLSDDSIDLNISKNESGSKIIYNVLKNLRLVHNFEGKTYINTSTDGKANVENVSKETLSKNIDNVELKLISLGVEDYKININGDYRSATLDLSESVLPKDKVSKNDNKTKGLIEFLSAKIGVPYEIITTKKAKSTLGKDRYSSDIKGFNANGKAYIIKNTDQISSEELLHPFISALEKENKELYNNLLSESKRSFPKLYEEIKLNYSKSKWNTEILTQSVARTFSNEFENINDQDRKSFKDLVKDMMNWIVLKINSIFKDLSGSDVINISELPENLTISDLVSILNTNLDTRFEVKPTYNLDFNIDVKTDIEILSEKKNSIVAGLKARMTALSKHGADPTKVKEIERLIKSLDIAEELSGLLNFIKHISVEVAPTLQRYFEKDNLTPDQLDQFNKDFIGFYSRTVNEMIDLTMRNSEFKSLDEDTKKNIKSILEEAQTLLNKANLDYAHRRLKVVQETLSDIGYRGGNPFIDELLQQASSVDRDENAYMIHTFSASNLKDEILRAVHFELNNLSHEVIKEHLPIANDIIRKYEELSKKIGTRDIYKYVYELDEKGLPTGYYVSPRQRAKYFQNKKNFIESLSDKYEVAYGDLPSDIDLRKAYMSELNQWYSDNAERRYVKSYYDMYNDLLPETAEILDDYDFRIMALLSPYRDSDGNLKVQEMPDTVYSKYESLRKEKSNLALSYYIEYNPDTKRNEIVKKEGIDLAIAEDIKKLNDIKRDKLKYKINQSKFDAENQRMRDTLSDADYIKWFSRSTKEVFSQDWYNMLKRISTKDSQSQEYKDLYDKRSAILSRFRDRKTGYVDTRLLPADVKKAVLHIDIILSNIKIKDKSTKLYNFSDIAEIQISPLYDKDKAELMDKIKLAKASGNLEAVEIAKNEFAEWDKNSHIVVDGFKKPASFYTKLIPSTVLKKPGDKTSSVYYKVTSVIPNEMWSEIDRESPFYNKNFDEKEAEYGDIPKKSLYDNSKQFDKLIQNKDIYDFYNLILNTIENANKNIAFVNRKKSYKAVQMSGDAIEKFKSKEKMSEGIKYFLKDELNIKDRDGAKDVLDVNPTNEDEVIIDSVLPYNTANMSKLKLIPTNYRRTLENPAELTHDVVGALIAYNKMAINWKIKNANRAKFELIKEQVSNRDVIKYHKRNGMFVTDKKGNRQIKSVDEKGGVSSNVYKMLNTLLDRELYGQIVSIDNNSNDISKVGERLSKHTLGYYRFAKLFLAPATIALNIGEVITKINEEVTVGTDISRKDLHFAEKELVQQLFNQLKDAKSNNKLTAILEYNRLLNRNEKQLDSSWIVRNSDKLLSLGYYQPEYTIKSLVVLSLYKSYRLHDGKFVNLSEFYKENGKSKESKKEFYSAKTSLYDIISTNKNGDFIVSPEYDNKTTQDLLNRLVNKSHFMAQRMDGTISEQEKIQLQFSIWGRFVMLFRGWMFNSIQKYFKAESYNYMTGKVEVGSHRAVLKRTIGSKKFWKSPMKLILARSIQMLNEMIPGLRNNLFKNWSQGVLDKRGVKEFSDAEKEALRRSLFDLYMVALPAIVFYSVLAPMMDDADDDDWGFWALTYFVRRFQFERFAFYNPLEFTKLLNSPSAYMNFFEDFVGFFTGMFKSLTADSEEESTISKGAYKDMQYWQKSVIKLTPAAPLWESQNPKAKFDYMEKQLFSTK